MKTSLFIGIFLLALDWNRALACPGIRKSGEPIGWSESPGMTCAALGASEWGVPWTVEGVSGWNSDCKPSLTADGKTICFQSDADIGPPYHPDHLGTGSNIYTAEWNGIQWIHPQPLDSAASWEGNYPFISSDGTRIFFHRKIGNNSDLFVTVKKQGRWSPAVAIGASVNTRDYNEEYPSLSFDQQELYFSSNRIPKFGKKDLWVSKWNGTDWGPPENLGPGVNKPNATNWNPFVSADKTKLFFSREQYSLFTTQELWVSEWTGTAWGEAVNAGAPINGIMHTCSAYLTPDGKSLYLGGEVTEGGRGGQDIWRALPSSVPFVKNESSGDPQKWKKTAALDSTLYVHCLMETQNGWIIAGTGPFGKVFKSSDKGRTWIQTSVLPDALKAYTLLESANGILYAGTYPKGDVFKTTNLGLSWTPCADIPGATTVSKLIEARNGVLLASVYPSDEFNQGWVYSSTDRGVSWSRLSPIEDVVGGVRTLCRTTSETVLAGCYSGSSAVYRSTDQGTAWTLIPLPIYQAKRDEWSQICFIKETAPGILYAGGWVHGPGQGGYIWKSTDDGVNWDTTKSRIRIDFVKATKVYDLIRGKNGTLVAGFQSYPDTVVALSRDDGITWESVGKIAGADETLCLLETGDGSLFAGTAPEGTVFQYQPATLVAETGDLPLEFELMQNFPNPFNASTAIGFTLPRTGRVWMDICDVSGRVIRKWTSENRSAGYQMISWDGKNDFGNPVGSGVYIFYLKYGKMVQTKKMLLLK